MNQRKKLPIEFQRHFSVHLYWASHGPLLLRSCKSEKHPTRVDILFYDVRWISLPMWMKNIRIERGELSEIPLQLTTSTKKEAHLMSVFRVISEGVTHYVLAGRNVRIAEDQKEFTDDSSLLTNFDFRAFVAPLWKKT
jgi:hypothetical protein